MNRLIRKRCLERVLAARDVLFHLDLEFVMLACLQVESERKNVSLKHWLLLKNVRSDCSGFQIGSCQHEADTAK